MPLLIQHEVKQRQVKKDHLLLPLFCVSLHLPFSLLPSAYTTLHTLILLGQRYSLALYTDTLLLWCSGFIGRFPLCYILWSYQMVPLCSLSIGHIVRCCPDAMTFSVPFQVLPWRHYHICHIFILNRVPHFKNRNFSLIKVWPSTIGQCVILSATDV